MERKEPSFIDLLLDAHINLDRQGPGSIETTERALSFIEGLTEQSKIVDLGCGSGGGTLTIARNMPCAITGLDIFPQFIDAFSWNMNRKGLSDRVKGIVGDIPVFSHLNGIFFFIIVIVLLSFFISPLHR